MVVLSKESADALANVPELGTWRVAPTMLRGAVKSSDMLGIPKKKEPKLKPSKAATKEQKKQFWKSLIRMLPKRKISRFQFQISHTSTTVDQRLVV